jgi:O-antigen/teichoic acid export membrane protein
MTLGVFTNFGLGAALIQRNGTASKKQLRAIFTALFLSSLAFIILIYLFAPLADIFYKGQLESSSIFWLRLFSISLLLVNITSVSGSLLEKKLDYKKITVGELSVLFLTQILTIVFALKGWGVASFVFGNLIGRLVGFFLFFYLSPWPIGFNFSYSDLKTHLPFGLNFQANSLVGAVNGAVVPGFVGAVSGTSAVGLVNWAGGVRQFGLAPVEIIGRLVFPTCAQAQGRKKFLKSLIERMIQVSCMFSFPLLAAIFALAPSITYIIYTSKWLPGLTALYLSVIQGVFILLGLILVQVLFALGEAKIVRNISLFWAILQWVLTVPLVLLWGFNGVVLAGILVSATFFIPLREVRKKVNISVWPHVLPYLGYSALTGLVMFWLSKAVLIESLGELLVVGGLGALFYWGIVFVLKKEELIRDFARFKELILKSA